MPKQVAIGTVEDYWNEISKVDKQELKNLKCIIYVYD